MPQADEEHGLGAFSEMTSQKHVPFSIRFHEVGNPSLDDVGDIARTVPVNFSNNKDTSADHIRKSAYNSELGNEQPLQNLHTGNSSGSTRCYRVLRSSWEEAAGGGNSTKTESDL
jgi:hypothetical protein